MQITKYSPVTALSGCGKKRAELLASLGIYDIDGLLHHFPRAYQNRGAVKQICDNEVGNTGSFVLTVVSTPLTNRISGGRTVTKCKAFDGIAHCMITFFNRAYVKDKLFVGNVYRFWGKLTKTKNGFELLPTIIEQIIEEKALISLFPLYPLTKGLTQNNIRSLISTAMNSVTISDEDDILPESIRKKLGVITERQALEAIHFPETEDMIKKGRDRFALEETFVFACSVALSKKGRTLADGKRFSAEKSDLSEFIEKLPFELTSAQKRVVSEIKKDLLGKHPCARLVSGDVGSGKTVCAMAAAYMAVKNGYQCVIMAPTEILAMQHYRDFSQIFEKFGIDVGYITASVTAAKRKAVMQSCESGQLKIVIGTHALLNKNVMFANLGLVITDEQHRFGVGQRAALQNKGEFPHVLVMSATPIPRTLALILMGDLDISVVDELPPGRQKVDTLLIDESYRSRLNGFIDKQVRQGRQVYIVCPSVEEKEDEDCEGQADIITFDLGDDYSSDVGSNLKSAVQYEQELRERIFPDFTTALLHGRMSGKEKDAIMKRFSDGEIDILVSTTVIEVGVNVPNATLMIVENAERFGLSQLHQLRGRVGRGSEKSYCVLISDSKGENARKRLEVMKNNSDGYKIAQFDLQLRGPGDFIAQSTSDGSISARQHGALGLKLAQYCSDTSMLDRVFKLAEETVNDVGFLDSENNRLAIAVKNAMGLEIKTIN